MCAEYRHAIRFGDPAAKQLPLPYRLHRNRLIRIEFLTPTHQCTQRQFSRVNFELLVCHRQYGSNEVASSKDINVTRREVLDALRLLGHEEQVKWMLDLGYQLTVAARGGYPVHERPGNITQLVAFNEMQHQVYGRIHYLGRGEEWTLESFLDGLMARAELWGRRRLRLRTKGICSQDSVGMNHSIESSGHRAHLPTVTRIHMFRVTAYSSVIEE